MRIFVDADSCPPRVREIVAAAAAREGIEAVFAANRQIPLPDEEVITMVTVPAGEGEADAFIVNESIPGDLAVTRDIPLAAELVEKGITVLNDRGEVYDRNNIRERLSIRDLMKDFREAGIMPDAQKSFSMKDIRLFANAFDRELRKLIKAGA